MPTRQKEIAFRQSHLEDIETEIGRLESATASTFDDDDDATGLARLVRLKRKRAAKQVFIEKIKKALTIEQVDAKERHVHRPQDDHAAARSKHEAKRRVVDADALTVAIAAIVRAKPSAKAQDICRELDKRAERNPELMPSKHGAPADIRSWPDYRKRKRATVDAKISRSRKRASL